MMVGMSFGIPLLKVILGKVIFSALNELWKNHSWPVHKHFVKPVDHQNNFV